ncbi:hypothetical protein [Achromobacter kerstersii]
MLVPLIRDGPDVWHQTAPEPHQYDVALAFLLQGAIGLNPI